MSKLRERLKKILKIQKDLESMTLQEKWNYLDKKSEKSILEYPEKYIASFLSIEPEEVNRIKQEGFEDDE